MREVGKEAPERERVVVSRVHLHRESIVKINLHFISQVVLFSLLLSSLELSDTKVYEP